MGDGETAEDITELMHEFRECVRHLWNAYFWKNVRTMENADLADQFDEIEAKLFSALVLDRIGVQDVQLTPSHRVSNQVHNYLRVEVQPPPSPTVMINRELNSGYWDARISEEELRQTKMTFIHFWDWDIYGFREWKYYLVQIKECPLKPEYIGRKALVEVGSASVMFLDNGR